MSGNSSIVIEQIHYSVTWYLRQKVMWPDKPQSYVRLDEDPGGYHFGLYADHVLTGVVSIFIQGKEAQFRKLAVLEEEQGKGYGKQLLKYVFNFAMQEGVERIWCNARIEKTGLYQKFGMIETEETFNKGGKEYVVMENGIISNGI